MFQVLISSDAAGHALIMPLVSLLTRPHDIIGFVPLVFFPTAQLAIWNFWYPECSQNFDLPQLRRHVTSSIPLKFHADIPNQSIICIMISNH